MGAPATCSRRLHTGLRFTLGGPFFHFGRAPQALAKAQWDQFPALINRFIDTQTCSPTAPSVLDRVSVHFFQV